MALGKYSDIYKLEGYKTRVAQIGAETSLAVNGPIMLEGKNALTGQIYLLQQKEAKIFELLGVKNIDELNRRMEEYKAAVINFSGAGLAEEFISILEVEDVEEYNDFQQAIKEILGNEYFDQEGQRLIVQQAQEKAMSILNEGFSKNRFTSTRGFTGGKIQTGKFTQWQKKRWKQLFETKFYNTYPEAKAYVDKHIKNKSPNISVSSQEGATEFSTSSVITWKTETKGLKPTEAKELYPVGSKELNEINVKMTNFIISRVPQDQSLIREIINYILSQEPYAFFVGGNTKDITGLLGEISGLYYLSKFLGGFSQRVISWRGGTHTGNAGSKPHQDLLLQDLGIQVKNSVEEDVGTVSFAEAGIKTMLDKAWLPDYVQNIFMNYYGTQAFNVPYYHNGDVYVEGAPSSPPPSFSSFEEWSQKLDGYQGAIDRLLSLSAAFFLYMDVYQGSKNIDANVLYFLGGTMFQTASNILKDILINIDNDKHNFNIRASYKQDGRNIVTALNEGTRSPNYSQVVLDNIELKSSYNFSYLFKKH